MKASIVIPVLNGEKTISKTLGGIQKQDAKIDFEVIVVNDGSRDKTAQVVQQFKGIRLVSQENAGPAVARNRGAKMAAGDIVVFLDADCVPKPDWLSEMLLPFENPSIVGVQGRYENPLPDFVARFVQLEIEERYERMKRHERIDFVGTYSAAYRRDVFLREGGFDEGFQMASGEDIDLSFRLAEKGFWMVFAQKAVVGHFHPTSLAKYWKTKFFRGFWRIRMYQRNPRKIAGDSYTPLRLKAEMLVIGFVVAAIGLDCLVLLGLNPFRSIEGILYFPLIGLAALFLLTLPTAAFMFSRDAKIGLVAPFVLSINAVLFAFGGFAGILHSVAGSK